MSTVREVPQVNDLGVLNDKKLLFTSDRFNRVTSEISQIPVTFNSHHPVDTFHYFNIEGKFKSEAGVRIQGKKKKTFKTISVKSVLHLESFIF